MSVLDTGPVRSRLRSLRQHQWAPWERAILVVAVAIVLGCLFVTTYSLALGDPVPRHIDAALVGDPTAHPSTVHDVERVARGSLVFRPYNSVPAAHHISFVLGLALAGSLVLTLVDGPLLDRPAGAFPEEWGILALHLVAAASFASLMAVLIDRWAIVPTWLFFVILGNASSGGAVSPSLLRQPFAFLSQWLPSGATVTALRDAAYFRDYQHARALAVLGVWAIWLFIAWLA